MKSYLPGFQTGTMAVTEHINIVYEIAGSGPALLLLHGYPQHRAMWRHIAPQLAKTHTVIAADLRGYGDSSTPPDDAAHTVYSKRAMAQDMAALMSGLGFERFALAGHDRGARVSHRMLRDYSERITRAALLDIIPTTHFWRTLDVATSVGYYHWMFLAQPAPMPEQMIGADRQTWVHKRVLRKWGDVSVFEPAIVQSYVEAFTPQVLAASCADYRAGASTDITDDDADFLTTKIQCPLLMLWGEKGVVGRCYDVMQVWRDYVVDAHSLTGQALPCGHFLPEECPNETLQAFTQFFTP